MTQAFNLSQLANNLNTSGQLDATDGLTGAVPVGNGGTGLTSVGTSGNVLTSNGSVWTSTAPASPTIADGSVTDPKISDGLANGSSLWIPLAGHRTTITNNELTTGNNTNQTMFSVRTLRGGSFSFRARVGSTSVGNTRTVTYTLFKNGVSTGLTQSVSSVANSQIFFTPVFSNLSVANGDIIDMRVTGAGTNSEPVYVDSYAFQFSCSITPRVIPFSVISNNTDNQALTI
jgi:hypothetical protein